MLRGCSGAGWVCSREDGLGGEDKAALTGTESWTPRFLPFPSRGTSTQPLGPPLGPCDMLICQNPSQLPWRPPAQAWQQQPCVGAALPPPSQRVKQSSGHTRTPDPKWSFLPSGNQGVRQRRSRRGMRNLSKEETGTPFPPTGLSEGTHCSHGC